MSDTIVGIQVTGDTSNLTQQLQNAGNAVNNFTGTVGYMFPALQNVSAAEKEVAAATEVMGAKTEEAVGFFTKLLSIVPAVGAGLGEIGAKALEAGEQVKEASAEMVESLVKVAEAGKIAQGGFSFLGAAGSLFGGAAILKLLDELTERLAENAVHFEHLAGATGGETVKLAALSQTMKEAGIENDNLGQAAIRYARAVESAANGGERQQRALSQLNITSKDFVAALGEAATHLQISNNYTQDAANLSILFGRNVQSLISFLRGSGSEFNSLIARHLEYGESLEKAIPAAQALIREQVRMRESFDELAFKSFPLITAGLQAAQREWVYLKELFNLGSIWVKAFGEIGVAAVGAVNNVVLSLNSALLQVGATLIGNISAAKRFGDESIAYVKAATQKIQEIPGIITAANEKSVAAMEAGAKELADLVARNAQKPLELKGRPEDGEGIEFGPSAKAKQAAREAEVENWEKHQLALVNIAREKQSEIERVEVTTAQSRLAAAKRFAQQEEQITLEAVRRKVAIQQSSEGAANDPAALVKLLGDRQAAQDKYNQEITKAGAKKAEDDKKEADKWDALQQESTQMQIDNVERVGLAAKKVADATFAENEKSFAAYGDYLQKRAAMDVEAALKRQQIEIEVDQKTLESKNKQNDLALSEKGFAGNWAARIKAATDYEQKIEADIAKLNQLAIEEAKAKDAEANREKFKSLSSDQKETFVPEDSRTQDAITNATKRMSAAQDEYNSKLAQMHKAQVDALQNSLFSKFNGQFTQFITSFVDGTESMSQAFRKFTLGLINDLISSLTQMALKWVETKAIELIVGKTTNEGLVFQAAGLAAANAYAATAVIPIVGPLIAPAAAATAFAGALAWGQAEQGALIGNESPMMRLHPKEMVLPQHLSTGVQNLINNNNSNHTSQSNSNGGDTHVHYHGAPGETPRSIANNEQAVLKIVRKATRNGKLSPSGAYSR